MSYVLLFFAAVLAEIASLVIVGGLIGWWTLAALAASVALGFFLLSGRGLGTLREAVLALAQGESPTPVLVDGVLLAAAGLLLIIPGFASDVVGLALLIPPVRAPLRARAVAWIRSRFRRSGAPVATVGDVIDVEATEVPDDDQRPTLSA